jgi:hypothetical protein
MANDIRDQMTRRSETNDSPLLKLLLAGLNQAEEQREREAERELSNDLSEAESERSSLTIAA